MIKKVSILAVHPMTTYDRDKLAGNRLYEKQFTCLEWGNT